MGYNPEEDCLLALLDTNITYDGEHICPYCEHFKGDLSDRADEHIFGGVFLEGCELLTEWLRDAFGSRKKSEETPQMPFDIICKKTHEIDDPKRLVFIVEDCEKYKRIFIDFNTYIKSPMWERTRDRAIEKAGYQCAFCGSAKNLRVHHITYQNIPFERDKDLVVVCDPCHKKLHEYDIAKREGKGRWKKRDTTG